ncbi:MAG: hypothetical protein ACRD4X_18515 [Candidatus Acidiferrales bacterium]
MRRFIEFIEACLPVGKAAVLLVAVVVLVELAMIEGSVRERLPRILADSEAAAQKFAAASDPVADAAAKQDRYLDRTSRELSKTVADAHDLLVHTDESLNGRDGRGGILPAASGLLTDQQIQLDTIEARANLALDDLDGAEKQAEPILASLNEAARRAARMAGNPSIAESLRRLDLALAESDATLANLQAISASGNRDAAMIENRLRQALKPASLLKSALLRALNIAGPAAQIGASLR